MSKPKNPMAFPVDSGNKQFPYQEGMTLRDYFAAAALTGILAGKLGDLSGEYNQFHASQDAYATADAMLKAREA